MALHDVHCRPFVLWVSQIENGGMCEALSTHGEVEKCIYNLVEKNPVTKGLLVSRRR